MALRLIRLSMLKLLSGYVLRVPFEASRRSISWSRATALPYCDGRVAPRRSWTDCGALRRHPPRPRLDVLGVHAGETAIRQLIASLA